MFISADRSIIHESVVDEDLNAVSPADSSDSPSNEPKNRIFGSIREESNAAMNSPIGSVNSHEYFNDEVAELHDYLEKVLIHQYF